MCLSATHRVSHSVSLHARIQQRCGSPQGKANLGTAIGDPDSATLVKS